MEKHNEFHTDISQNGTQFRLTFITNDKNNFLVMQDLARKCIDGKDVLTLESLENRILVLEHDKKMRDVRDKVTSLFATMQYGTLGADPERTAYYKSKLNEIFGSGTYQDTDCVTKEADNGSKDIVDNIFGEFESAMRVVKYPRTLPNGQIRVETIRGYMITHDDYEAIKKKYRAMIRGESDGKA